MITGATSEAEDIDSEDDACHDAVISQLTDDLSVLVEEFGPERVATSLVYCAMAIQDLDGPSSTAWLREFLARDIN